VNQPEALRWDDCGSAYEQGLQQHEAEAGGLLVQMSAKPLINISSAMRKSYLSFQTILAGLSVKEIQSKIGLYVLAWNCALWRRVKILSSWGVIGPHAKEAFLPQANRKPSIRNRKYMQ